MLRVNDIDAFLILIADDKNSLSLLRQMIKNYYNITQEKNQII